MFEAFERRLSVVPRWVIVPTLFKQNVAEHSFYVALYTDKLCLMTERTGGFRANAVAYALRHDMQEVMHGDIPGPAKDRFVAAAGRDIETAVFLEGASEDYKVQFPLDEAYEIKMVVKFADKLDAAMFMRRELITGNVGVQHIYDSHLKWMAENHEKAGLTHAQFARIVGKIQHSADVRLPI